MQDVRELLLAHARLAEQEDGQVGAGQVLDLRVQVAHGRGVARDVAGGKHERAGRQGCGAHAGDHRKR